MLKSGVFSQTSVEDRVPQSAAWAPRFHACLVEMVTFRPQQRGQRLANYASSAKIPSHAVLEGVPQTLELLVKQFGGAQLLRAPKITNKRQE